MEYLVVGLIIILCSRCKSSKFVMLLTAFLMWALIGLNTFSADYEEYRKLYEASQSLPLFALEPGYMVLTKTFSSLAISYETFRMIVAIPIVYLYISTGKYYTKYVNVFLALSIIFPFIIEVSGLRTALAGSIVIYGLKFLFTDGRKGIFKFIVTIIIAAMFHYLSLFFIIFLLARRKEHLTIKPIIITLVVLLVAAAAFTNIIYDILSLFTDNAKLLGWVDMSDNSKYEHTSLVGMIVGVLRQCLLLITYRYARKIMLRWVQIRQKNEIPTGNFLSSEQHIAICDNIMLLSLFLLPFLAIHDIFSRIFYIFCKFSYCITAISIQSYASLRKKGILLSTTKNYMLLFQSILCIMLVLLNEIYTPQNSIFEILSSNKLW